MEQISLVSNCNLIILGRCGSNRK